MLLTYIVASLFDLFHWSKQHCFAKPCILRLACTLSLSNTDSRPFRIIMYWDSHVSRHYRNGRFRTERRNHHSSRYVTKKFTSDNHPCVTKDRRVVLLVLSDLLEIFPLSISCLHASPWFEKKQNNVDDQNTRQKAGSHALSGPLSVAQQQRFWKSMFLKLIWCSKEEL